MSHLDPRIALSRRTLLQGSLFAGAAGLLGACAKSSTTATALVDVAPAPRTPVGHYPFRVGAIEGLVLSDGALTLGPVVPNIVVGATAEEVKALLDDAFLSPDALRAELNTVLFRTGSRHVMIDCGYGPAGLPAQGHQDAALAAAGLTPADIDVVFITHAHPDHINGYTDATGASRFPNAELVINEQDYNFWSNPANDNPAIQEFLDGARARFKAAGARLRTIKAGDEIAPGIVAEAAYGHTPGHSIVRVASEGQQLIVTADTANHHILYMRRPDWGFGFDADKPAASATRVRVFDMLAADKVRLLAYHFPFPGIGRVRRVGARGYEFVPEAWGSV